MKSILFALLISANLMAQNFEFGFKLNGVNTSGKIPYYPLMGLGLAASIETFPNLFVDARVLYQLVNEDYRGWEYFLLTKYKVQPAYLIGGVYIHDNYGYGTNGGGAYNKRFTFASMGVGVNILKFLSVEFLYNTQFKEDKYAYSRLPDKVFTFSNVMMVSLLFLW